MAAKIRKQPIDDLARLRAELLALPLPPHKTQGRPHPTHTLLGRVMRLKGVKVNDIIRWDGAPSYRQMAEYLAGRRRLNPEHRLAIARGMNIDPRLLEE